MPGFTLPPPPPATAHPPPLPRPALQDASARANQSPVRLPPFGENLSLGGLSPSLEYQNWREGLAGVRKQAYSLRSAYQNIVADSVKSARMPQDPRTALDRSAVTSGEYMNGRALDKTSAPGNPQAPHELFEAAAKAKAAAAKPAASNSRKRKSETTLQEDIAAYKQDLSEIEVDDTNIDLNCNQVRTRINKVIDNGIMKKGEFCTAIGSSSAAVNMFLKKSGPEGGIYSGVYTNAWAWFKKRELAGLKMPEVKKRQQAEAAATIAAIAALAGATTGPAAKKAKTTAAASATPDISGIHLAGEETDSVPVFDTCDEIRKKISAHLKTPGLTQAQFCRDLYAQFKAPTCKAIRPKQVEDFRGKTGAIAGCTSAVFYAAYVYFEKLRIAKGKPKTAHRLKMESIYPGKGIDRDHDGRNGFWAFGNERPYVDEYGRLEFI